MNIASSQSGSNVIVKLSGRMDAQYAPTFEDACKSWIDQGFVQFIVDMSELAYVSSLGLRSIVLIGKLVQEKGGSLRMCGLTGLVKQVFEITRLHTVFPLYASVESALAAA